jgi:hypothetical protein
MDNRDWLSRERLELHVIINLAHGRDPRTSPISTEPLLPRLRALKDAIDSGELDALPRMAGNPNANLMSRVKLSDLWAFANADARREDLSWDWLRTFCWDWSQVRGKPLPDVGGLQPPAKVSPDQYRTGLPGRPTIKHLIEHEFRRRADNGELCPTLKAKAQALCDWAARNHPEAPRSRSKTVMNYIREAYREAMREAQN